MLFCCRGSIPHGGADVLESAVTASPPMPRRRHRARAGLRLSGAALILLLAGCAGGAPDATFDLSAAPIPKRLRSLQGQVAIHEPVATAPIDSDRIVVRPTTETLATLKGAQWAERLPRLIQTRLLQSFENAGLLRFVGRPDGRFVAQFSLNADIRRFDLDLSQGEAVVELSVRLVEEGAGRVLAAKIFTARCAVTGADGADAAAAFDGALGAVMGQIVVWTAAQG